MANKTLSQVVGSGGSLPKLAPDLTWPSDKVNSGVSYKKITGIDGSSGYVTALSLTGAFSFSYLEFNSMINEDYDVRLTVDGVVIWDDTVTVTTNDLGLIGQISGGLPNSKYDASYRCESSLLLEIQSTTDTSVDLNYLVRPIS